MSKHPTKSQLKSNIWKFYFFKIFGEGLALVAPVMVLFWQDNGLTLTQVMILQAFFAIMLIFFEVPSGYLADIMGRKKTFHWAALFYLIPITIYSISSAFTTFLIAEAMLAVGVSLLSGADSAFVYDTLKALDREKEYKKIWGKTFFYSVGPAAFMSLLGGHIGAFDTRYTWYVAIIPTIFMLLITFTLHEPERTKLVYKKGYTYTLFKTIHDNVLKQAKLKWFIIYTAVIFMATQGAFWFYQPLFELTKVDIVYFGYIFATFNIFAAFTSRHAHQIEEWLGKKQLLIALGIFSVAGLFLMSKVLFLFTFIFIFLHQFVRGVYSVIVSDYINELTESSVRATILSVQNLFARFLYAITIPILGYISDVYSLPQALFVLGVTALVTGAGVLLVLHRYKLI